MTDTQISEEAVQAKTSKTWKEWFAVLDAEGCEGLSHKEIVAVLHEKHHVADWWQQSITVAYEQARGLRKPHQRPNGFQISKSKTLTAGVDAVYKAWAESDARSQWLADPQFTIRKATPKRSLRITWVDGITTVDVLFYPKVSKVQVSLNHSKLADSRKADEMKAYWTIQLERLAEYLD